MCRSCNSDNTRQTEKKKTKNQQHNKQQRIEQYYIITYQEIVIHLSRPCAHASYKLDAHCRQELQLTDNYN